MKYLMKHLINTPVSCNRASVGACAFASLVLNFLFHGAMLLSTNIYSTVVIIICSLFIIGTVGASGGYSVKHTTFFKDAEFLLAKVNQFYAPYKYIIKTDLFKEMPLDKPYYCPKYFFITKKAAVRYCLEQEKQRLKEGANNIPSVMRLQAML